MSELAQFLNMRGKLGLHCTRYPSGKYGFIGSVPQVLCYSYKDGSQISETDARDISSFGPGLILRSRGIVSLAWDTREEALAAAHAAGFEVKS